MEQKVIAVSVNKKGFEYDIHSLVKAFYPECDVKVRSEDEGDLSSSEGCPEISLVFSDEEITLSFAEKSEEESSSSAGFRKVTILPGMERAEVKNRLKRLIYEALSEHGKKELPWGTLTGIRPVKIPMSFLEQKKDEEEILAYMKNTYLVSEEKGLLAIAIAKRERELLSKLHAKDGYSLYIGIPFCPTTCLYCSFTSFPLMSWEKKIGEYLTALEKEIDFTAERLKEKTLDTVYIGGGTPTTLDAFYLDRLLGKLRQTFDFSQVKEFTVEAGRPDSITKEKLAVLKKQGVTRISVNPQTMKEETLRLIGRQHTVEQVRNAFCMARETGFDNINMDIILGLPGETKEDVKATIEEIKKLSPDSLTVHSLAVKRASRLNRWIEENGIASLNNTDETMKVAASGAKDMGMDPYYLYRQKNMSGNFENVGYAKAGKEGLYNILIMEEVQDIAALGAGSISKRVWLGGRIERCDNVKEVQQYIDRIDEMIERKRRLFES